jgi:branched-chain amino acid transport system substrate-binding protein
VMTVVANWNAKGHEQLSAEFMQYSGEPWMTQNPLAAYGHIWLLKEALEISGKADRASVTTALRSMDLTGGAANYFAGKRVRFDATGKRIDAEILVVQWQDGKPATVYPPNAATAEIRWPQP